MKKLYKKSKIKKYNTGTQVIGNTDPTTLYATNRDMSVADTQFNNSQQSLLNQGNIQQGYQDKFNTSVGDYQGKQAGKTATSSAVSSGLSAIPGIGAIAGAGYQLGSSTGDSFNQKSFDKALATGEGSQSDKMMANILTPTSSKLLNAKNAVDVAEAFVPLVDFGKSSQDIAEQKAVYAKQRQDYANKQLKDYGAVDSSVQATQLKKGRREIFLKNAKYKKKEGVREIETEGREPIFSPKKKDGTRDLIYYNPNDPTHKEGGVKGIVTKNSNIKAKNAVVIPEGSAIISAKDGMNKKALKAYKEGDRKKLEKVINKMPDDKSNKKALGTDDLGYGFEDASGNRYSSYARPAYEGINPSAPVGGAPEIQTAPLSQVNTTPNKKTYNTSKLNSVASGALQAAPSIYNLARGIFEKPQLTNRRYVNNKAYQYQDFSDPNRRAANEQFRVESDNIRNATGGSGATYLANQSLAAANRFKNMSDINTQEAAKRQDLMNMNTQMSNQQNAQNMGLANQYDDLDLQNRARKNDFVASGLTGLSDLSFHKQRDKNMANADQMRLNTLETSQYKYDPTTGKYIFKSALGIKNVKYKKKK